MTMTNILITVWICTLVAAAISDLRAFRIPNVFPAIILLLFGVAEILGPGTAVPWQNILHFGVALVVGMFLFSRGWIGGGDAKLYAAVALWFTFGQAALLLFFTTMSGALLAAAFIAARLAGLRKNVPKADRRIPYGVAIALGAIISAAFFGWPAIFA